MGNITVRKEVMKFFETAQILLSRTRNRPDNRRISPHCILREQPCRPRKTLGTVLGLY